MSANIEPMATLQIRLPQELLQRIDNYRLSLTMRPTRSMMMRFLLENAMGIIEEQLREQSKNTD
jgi:hypothetical protein